MDVLKAPSQSMVKVNLLRRRAPPEARLTVDVGGERFRNKAILTIPSLLEWLKEPDYCDHLMIDLDSDISVHHLQDVYVISAELNGRIFGSRAFRTPHCRHQFMISLSLLFRDRNELILTAEADEGTSRKYTKIPIFTIGIYLFRKEKIENETESKTIWLFSSARSGSTWLASDIIASKNRVRLMAETGLGRMFAPLHWVAERFFDIAARDRYSESGFSDQPNIAQGSLAPVFIRSFRNLDLDTQILNQYNMDFYHELLRDIALRHILVEWGALGYDRVIFKMPNDSHGADYIMRAFPRSHLVFLMRDGRDVLRSRFSPFASSTLAQTSNKALRQHGIAFYSHFWNFQVNIIQSAFEGHDKDLRILVRYEDLRTDPRRHIGHLLQHLGMSLPEAEFEALLESSKLENFPAAERGPDKPRQQGKVGGFRDEFDEEEIALMNRIMGPNLKRYGYDVD